MQNTVVTPYSVTLYNIKFTIASVFLWSTFFPLFVFVKYDSIKRYFYDIEFPITSLLSGPKIVFFIDS